MDGGHAIARRTAPEPQRWPISIIVSVALLVLVTHWANGQLQQHEFDTLLVITADAESTGDAAAAEVLSTRAYTMPLLVSSSSATVREGLEALIEQSAGDGVTSLEKDREKLTDITILPWHTGLRQAQRTDLAYVDQRLADFKQVAAGADLGLLNSTSASAAAMAAADGLRAAAPSGFDAANVAAAMKNGS